MITSLLEPCLIIPNYAARHLVLSVSPTMLPEQQLARCSVCVQSPWYHRWACSPILAGYNAETYAVVLIIQHGIVQEGVYSVSPAAASFLQFVTQFTQTWSVERFRPCMWCTDAQGRLALIVGEKTNSLQEKWKFLVKSCLSSFKFFHLRWFSFFSTHIPPQWYMNGQTLVLLAVWMLCRRTMSYYVCFVRFELKGDATANRGYYMQTRRLLNYLADIWLWIKTGCQHVDMTGVRIRFNLNIFSWLNLNWNLPHFAFRSC